MTFFLIGGIIIGIIDCYIKLNNPNKACGSYRNFLSYINNHE